MDDRDPDGEISLKSLGAWLAALAVLLGAFGAHILSNILSKEGLEWWQTGNEFLWYHALAVLVLSARSEISRYSLIAMMSGLVFFSGGLFAYAISEESYFGIVIPIGGIQLVFAWCWVALQLSSNLTNRENRSEEPG